MSQTVDVNGVSINYPETGDTGWGDEATNFAIQTSSAFSKLGLSSGTSVDIPGTLDVTGATTLDSNLSVAGNSTITGNLTVNGNTVLGNATSDTITITGAVAIDTNVLIVDATNNRIGINKTTPAQALDVVGNSAISGNETVGGTLGVTGNTTLSGTLGVTGNTTLSANLSVNGNTTIGDTSGDSLTINGTAVSIPNGLNIDSNTFVIDATNNRIGIGTSSPGVALDLIGTIRIRTSSTSGYGFSQFGNSSTSTQNWHAGSEGDGNYKIYNGNIGAGVNAFQIASNGQLSAVVPSGSTLYPGYLCRAWVNFDGTTSPGTIRSHGNINSITRNATGDYTINFINNMPDINYSYNISNSSNYGVAYTGSASINTIESNTTESAPTISSFRFCIRNSSNVAFNPKYLNVSVFR